MGWGLINSGGAQKAQEDNMGFNWTNNIRCTISEGSAFLSKADLDCLKCQGRCSECNAFLGVNLSMVGEKYFDGSCSAAVGGQTIMRGV